jgi:hypothetical protein
MGIVDRVVARYKAKQAERADPEVRKLESASFADGNGGYVLTITEETSPPSKDGTQYKHYKLLASISHFSATTEIELPLGNHAVVEWLIGSLGRVMPLVVENQSNWDIEFYGPADVKITNGEVLPDPPSNTATYSADDSTG